MNPTDKTELADRSPSEKFVAYLRAVTKDARSFASCVRAHHAAIENAIRDGASLEAIAHGLSQTYGVRGSLAALKSALNRIRRMREAEIDRQWYDTVDQEQYGTLAFQTGQRGSAYPVNGKMSPPSRHGGSPYDPPAQQHLPGMTVPAPGGGYSIPHVPLPPFPRQWMQQQNAGSPLYWFPTSPNGPFDDSKF
ncbi:hypothetical protein [Burkholderia anthina]|uniref:hypothetical protein n=1 Tax=Burkholderia anthina TaxID=179879 RepID=UPI0012DA6A56|nr:hypothetical protein [Burkholderia anthina]